MTNRWHFDITVTQAEDLERNYIRNICFVTRSTHTTDGFWHVFGSMGFLQLEDENSRTEYQLQSRSPEVFRRLKGIRIGNSLNCDYTFSFSMKLSPQQLVYDQDANRSRRFILTLGPPWISLLNALYSVSYLWIYGLLLDLVSGFTYFKRSIIKCYAVNKQLLIQLNILGRYVLQLSQSRHKFTIDSRRRLTSKGVWYMLL